MKRKFAIGLIFLFLALGFLNSCKEEVAVDPIVGIWEFSEEEEDFSRFIKLTFNPDNTGLEEIDYIIYGQPDSNNSNFVYLVKNGILTLFYGVEPSDYPYSISGNKLTISYPSEELTFTKAD
jgi:hypothetical protein